MYIYEGIASIVQLGKRIFVTGGASNVTEEFNLTTNSWSVVPTPLMNYYRVNIEESIRLRLNMIGILAGLPGIAWDFYSLSPSLTLSPLSLC
jgi:hypothetical protein